MINPFFQNKGPFKIDKILSSVKVVKNFDNLDIEIFDIKDLVTATTKDITFFHSKKYEPAASATKASYCLTTNKLSNILPKNCKPVEVDNVLVSTAMITSMFYPDSITDNFDINGINIETLFLINVFLIMTFDPIEQLSPITTLLSIIVL